MKISLNDLKILCEIILSKAEKSGMKEIEVDHDFYWSVSSEDVYNFTTEKPEVIVGSFVDDFDSLRKLLDSTNQATIVDIERLGNVIKIMGDVIHESENIY